MKTRTMMSSLIFVTILSLGFFSCFGSCNMQPEANLPKTDQMDTGSLNTDTLKSTIKIKVGNKTFTATLLNSSTADSFKSLLPLRLTMTDLNDNEKYFHLSTDLPVQSIKPGTIQSGDLMLWGSNSFVIFYKTFSTSYSYTRLGKIDDPSGLAEALGKGDVVVELVLL